MCPRCVRSNAVDPSVGAQGSGRWTAGPQVRRRRIIEGRFRGYGTSPLVAVPLPTTAASTSPCLADPPPPAPAPLPTGRRRQPPPGGHCRRCRCPAGRCPAGRYPAGRCPGGRCPAGRCPAGRCPAGPYPAPLPACLHHFCWWQTGKRGITSRGIGLYRFPPQGSGFFCRLSITSGRARAWQQLLSCVAGRHAGPYRPDSRQQGKWGVPSSPAAAFVLCRGTTAVAYPPSICSYEV